MVSIITHAFVILDMLEGTAIEILMTAALLLVITVRLLNKEKTKVQNYTKKKGTGRTTAAIMTKKKRKTSPFLGSILTADINFLGHVM